MAKKEDGMESTAEKQTEARILRQASLTVEASFVIPLVLAVIFLLISLDFYIHEKAVQTLAACESVLAGNHAGRTSGELGRRETSFTLNRLLREDPLPMAAWESSVEFGTDRIRAEVIGQLMPAVQKERWTYRVEAKLARIHPAERMRNVRALRSLLPKKQGRPPAGAGGG